MNAAIAGTTPNAPSTQPTAGDDPLVSLEKLRAINDPKLNEEFARTMEDIVWFEPFYQSDPKTASPFLHCARAALPADNLVLQRLQGWSLAEQGKTDEVRWQHFTAAAQDDPFAVLGLIRLDRARDREHTRHKPRKLLADHPMGLLAAVLRECFSKRKLPLPGPPLPQRSSTLPLRRHLLRRRLPRLSRHW